MGKLIIKGENKIRHYIDQNRELHTIRSGYFTNADAVKFLISYITRSRPDENRADELLFWGALGADECNVAQTIAQFEYVQNNIRTSTCRKMYHFVYAPDDDELRLLCHNISLIHKITIAQAQVFYNWGHQVAYAVHMNEACRLHIHYAVNAVNFMTGAMFRYTNEDYYGMSDYMTDISDTIIKHENLILRTIPNAIM